MSNDKRVNGHKAPVVTVPPFVRRRVEVADDNQIASWDGWDVQSTGDAADDYALGQHYADIAVRLAQDTGNPAHITFSLSAIYLKQAHGLIQAGEIERGFIERIASLATAASLN